MRGTPLLLVSGTETTSAFRSFHPPTRSCFGSKKQGQPHLPFP